MKLEEILEAREKAKDIALVQKLRAKLANPSKSKTTRTDGPDLSGGMAGYPGDSIIGGGNY